MDKQRCPWGDKGDMGTVYHDEEWGVPRYGDDLQFEFLTLEAAQAGLSWNTILRKREGYRTCFAGFDPQKVARFTQTDVERLMMDASIVRNRKKIESAINNARRFLEMAEAHGSFCNWFWRFTEGRPIWNAWTEAAQVPATTPLSDRIAKEMKKLGFSFMGSTVVYAHMQGIGMINDHLVSCFRHQEVQALAGDGCPGVVPGA